MVQKGRGVSTNYIDEEIARLLDTIEDVLPLGSKERAVVTTQFNNTGEEMATVYNQASFKKDFDKLAAMNECIRDSSCPPVVWKPKQGSQSINDRVHVGIAGNSVDEKDDCTDEADEESAHKDIAVERERESLGRVLVSCDRCKIQGVEKKISESWSI